MNKQQILSVLRGILALGVVSSSVQAWAVEPHYIKLSDSVVFMPGLQFKESYDDNIHADEQNELSSWVSTLAPSFSLFGIGNKSSYLLNYTATSDTFHDSREDDNVDHTLQAEATLEFTARHRLQLTGNYRDAEDVVNRNQAQDNNHSQRSFVDGLYTYGARSARAQLDLGASYEALRYANDNGLNSENERNSRTLKSTLYYRVAPLTRVLLELRHTDHDYLVADEDSSADIDLLTGITWDATAKTSGTIKFGRGRKNYDDSRIDSASTGLWEVGITWKPLTYSTFTLSTQSRFDEGGNYGLLGDGSSETDGGSAVRDSDDGAAEIQTHRLGWKHYWHKHVYSDLGYSYTDLEYLDSNRQDKLSGFNAGLTYEARRWLDLGIGYRYSENDSTRPGENYERNVYALTISVSL